MTCYHRSINQGKKGTVYDRISGKEIINYTEKENKEIAELAKKGKMALKYSDLLNNHNLLRFYTPKGFKPVDPGQFDYLSNFQQMEALRAKLKTKSTALISTHKHSTTRFYRTDAPELNGRHYEITEIPESVAENHLDKKRDNDSQKKKREYN